MKNDFNAALVLLIFISIMTIFISNFGSPRPTVLGSTTTAAKVYDDGNGTLYVEYSNPLDVYNTLSSWQGKYPGRTIYTSGSLNTGSTKYFGIIFTYIGK